MICWMLVTPIFQSAISIRHSAISLALLDHATSQYHDQLCPPVDSGSVAAALLFALLHSASAAQPPASAPPYTVVSREGRRPLAARTMAARRCSRSTTWRGCSASSSAKTPRPAD